MRISHYYFCKRKHWFSDRAGSIFKKRIHFGRELCIPHSRCTENSMVDLSKRPGANPQGMPKFWQQKILYRNQKANPSKSHGSTNPLFSKKSPLSGPMYHQIRKRRSVSQEQNTLLKSQNPGNVGYTARWINANVLGQKEDKKTTEDSRPGGR